MRRKILLGALALALPTGLLAMTESAAVAKASPNPVACDISATITLSVGLSPAGVLSAKGDSSITTVDVTFSNCSDAAGPTPGGTEDLSINTAASKPSAEAQAAGDSKHNYYLGDCGAFASANTTKGIGKSLKNLVLPIGGGELKGPKATEGTVGDDVGFNITGTVKGGTYPTAGKGASIGVGLLNDTNNGNLLTGCHSGTVTAIDVDSSQSSAVL